MNHTIMGLTTAFLIVTSGEVLSQSGQVQQGVNTEVCKAIGGTKKEDGTCVYGNITFMPTKGKDTCIISIAPRGESEDKSANFPHQKTCTKLIKEAFPHTAVSKE